MKLTELKFLKTLPHLEELLAADNNFDNSAYIAASVNHLGYLTKATFTNCPAQKNDIYYRNKIILESKSLGNSFKNICPNLLSSKMLLCYYAEILDGKIVSDVTRTFLKSFDRVKAEQKQKLTNTTNSNNAKIVDIDLREDLPIVHSEGITFDVTNIISQAIVENIQNKPWTIIQ